MSEKVKLPHEVAEAIKFLRNQEMTNYGIISLSDQIPMIGRDHSKEVVDALTVIRKFSFHNTEDDAEGEVGAELIIQAIVNGYEVEQTPEDKVREAYNNSESATYRCGLIDVLNIYGIKIEGVNA